jgi:hypothetical protein
MLDAVAGTLKYVLHSKRRELKLKFQMQHSEPFRPRMLRWTYEASTSAARTVA